MKKQSAFAHLARVALVAVGYFVCAESNAWASCGDHVIVLSQVAPEHRSFFEKLAFPPDVNIAKPATQPRPSSLPCGQCPYESQRAPFEPPCRGPHCSDAPQPEGVPLGANPVKTLEQWTIFLHFVKLQQLTPAGFIEPADSITPIRQASSIFHPPRCS